MKYCDIVLRCACTKLVSVDLLTFVDRLEQSIERKYNREICSRKVLTERLWNGPLVKFYFSNGDVLRCIIELDKNML